MLPFLHLLTVLTPVVVFGLFERLFRVPADLPWVVTVIGAVTSGVTLLLARPGLRRLAQTRWVGAGLVLSGTLLIITTPLLGFQQVRSFSEGLDSGFTAQLPWLVTATVVVLAVWVMLQTARRLTPVPQVLTPLYLVAGEILLLMALEGRWFVRVVTVVFALLLFVALEDLYLAFHQPTRHSGSASLNIATYLGAVTYFAVAASLLWLMIFFSFPLWLGALLLGGLTVLLTYQTLWAIGGSGRAGIPYLVALPVVSMELFWAVSYLPTSVYVGALLLTAGWYVVSGCGRNQLLGTLHRHVVWRYLIIGGLSVLVGLLTAKCQVALPCLALLLGWSG